MTDHDFTPKKPPPEEVMAYRDDAGCGVAEARKNVYKTYIRESLAQLKELGDLEDKVAWLLARYEESL